jgi:hypothetical protein
VLHGGLRLLSRSRFDVAASLKRHRFFNGNIERLFALIRRIGRYLRNWALIAEPDKE